MVRTSSSLWSFGLERSDRGRAQNSSVRSGRLADDFRAVGRSQHGMASSRSHTVVFAIRGPLTRADLPGLGERASALLTERGAEIALCDVCGVAPDAVTVDALLRLRLVAKRQGCHVRLFGASEELLALVDFMGLADALPA